MSQKLQFYKTVVYREEILEFFPYENIHSSLQGLLKGTESKTDEYVEKNFEPISLKYLRIENAHLEKIYPDYSKKLRYPLFDPKTRVFFMMDHQVWEKIMELVESFQKETLNDSKKERTYRIERNTGIGKDYETLSNLFEKKILCATVF